MNHAAVRILQRLHPTEQLPVARAIGRYAAEHRTGSHAVRVQTLRAIRGEAWSDASNGDVVVAIVRDGTVETIMLRRSSQPFTRAALHVETLATL